LNANVTVTIDYQCHIYHWLRLTHLPLITIFTFTIDCKCHIYHWLPMSHLPLNASVTFPTDYQCHINHWIPVSQLLLITSVTFTTISGKCDSYNQWQMWLWQSVVNVTLTIRGFQWLYTGIITTCIAHHCIHLCRRLNCFCWGR
jgi:hypothetical protein